MIFNKFELEAMEALWTEGRPLTRSELVQRSPNQILKLNSMPYVLKNLQEKGAVVQSGAKKEIHHFAGQYIATITREEYVAEYLTSEVPGLDFGRLFATLAKRKRIDRHTLTRLKEIMDSLG